MLPEEAYLTITFGDEEKEGRADGRIIASDEDATFVVTTVRERLKLISSRTQTLIGNSILSCRSADFLEVLEAREAIPL